MYVCWKCKRPAEDLERGRLTCSSCGYRIFIKPRPEVVKKVKAR